MRRREFISLLGGAVATWPFVAQAQQGKPKRLGMLIPYSEDDSEAKAQVSAFLDELRRFGWAERNLQIEARWMGGNASRVPIVAQDVINRRPDVILARSTAVTASVLRETATIPIVFVMVSDPVGDGFVASVARPGRNATGFTNVEDSLGGKWLELLKEMKPTISRVAVVFGPNTSAGGGAYYLRLVANAADKIAVSVSATPVDNADEVEKTVAAFAENPNGALIVTPDLTTSAHRDAIVASAARYRVPAIYPFPYVVREGGLISYGIDATDIYRRAAVYVDDILHGAKASELPVQAPTKFELAINLKAVKALGLTVPDALLATADEVFE